ncbi:MAG TPA: bifunctional YncE family protein/alkaline phosphatase family protein [Bryobacteraceae bacterium]|nr:bifunctional YncE family protein/alkaline phosphatase family protein [Bryobacteraceae bacterium]
MQTIFQGRVYGLTFGATTGELWVLNAGQVFRMDWQANRIIERVPLAGTPGLAGLRFDPATGQALATAAANKKAGLFVVAGGKADEVGPGWNAVLTGAPAIAPRRDAHGRRLALVPLVNANQVGLVDLATGQPGATVEIGKAPFGAVIDAGGTVGYVSNWGGRVPAAGDLTGATGLAKDADRVVVDRRGIASTGTISRIDLTTAQVTHTIAVGLHPTALAWDEAGSRLYVANGNEDSISVIDTREQRVVRTIALAPFGRPVAGIAPTALALAPDGSRLYAACGGINAVAVVQPSDGKLLGLIPTAWYPNGLAISPDGRYLAVATLLGPGSGWREEPRKRFVHANRGSISVLPIPDAAQLASYTTAVAENNHVPPAETSTPSRNADRAAMAVPVRAGDPSPIEYVVYVIKENRTYDQVFGDIAKGNGDPSLVMFGAEVTPNQHRIAEQFVLLDNFYATGGNSGDGHQWLTQANETDYCLWPGYVGRSYPFDGTDPIAYSKNGFIWDAALTAGKTVRVYGEYAGRRNEASHRERADLLEEWRKGETFLQRWQTTAPLAPLNAILARNYPSYSTSIPDVARARIFLADLEKWKNEGRMPNLTIVQLPSNHTRGTAPGTSTPKAMVADNDLALGQIVEALTHTPFWKKMAIFVVEDDAQNGVDHVDGHRTVALVASPYARRGHVDSTFYSHPGMLKTIELILGLPSLSLFDLIANDMRASFQNEPDFTGYDAVTPSQSLFDVNPPLKALAGVERQAARASMKMRFDVPDAAPTEKLNRILWHQVRGWTTPYPEIRRAAFGPLTLDLDDDER